VCHAVEGLFLSALEPAIGALRTATDQARRDGVDVVFVTDGRLGDATVVAAGLGAWTPEIVVGVRVGFGPEPHRHPTVLAREITTLDHVTAVGTVVAFMGPFTGATSEAIRLCRDMWRNGVAYGEDPHYPVPGAVNRPLPMRPGGPPIALDLTGASAWADLTAWADLSADDASAAGPIVELLALCDMVLVTVSAIVPDVLPPGVDVCRVRGA